ncbi:MAG TPA: hypothetical protein VN203_05525, partial [Candidatus Acidoferrum sp.]|nr:hypothetical protein [Candidatus Acidoferrum sp.]
MSTQDKRQFQNALNEVLVGIYYPEQLDSIEEQEVIRCAYRMAQQPFIPDPAWSAQVRARLVEQARANLPAQKRKTARTGLQTPFLRTLGGLALMICLIAGLSWAVQNLRPQAPNPLPAAASPIPTSETRGQPATLPAPAHAPNAPTAQTRETT